MWPEVWFEMGKAVQKKDKLDWAKEKSKLDNARRLRAIYFISPEDGECKETIKKRMEKVGSSKGGVNALQDRNKEALPATGN